MCSACPTSPPSSAAASPRPSSLGASGRKKTSSWACFGASPPVFLVPSEYRTNDWNRKFAIVSLAKTLREREVRRARAKVCVGRSVVPINPSSLLSTHQALLLACLSSTERRGEAAAAEPSEHPGGKFSVFFFPLAFLKQSASFSCFVFVFFLSLFAVPKGKKTPRKNPPW
jgi:hypothetical protein